MLNGNLTCNDNEVEVPHDCMRVALAYSISLKPSILLSGAIIVISLVPKGRYEYIAARKLCSFAYRCIKLQTDV